MKLSPVEQEYVYALDIHLLQMQISFVSFMFSTDCCTPVAEISAKSAEVSLPEGGIIFPLYFVKCGPYTHTHTHTKYSIRHYVTGSVRVMYVKC